MNRASGGRLRPFASFAAGSSRLRTPSIDPRIMPSRLVSSRPSIVCVTVCVFLAPNNHGRGHPTRHCSITYCACVCTWSGVFLRLYRVQSRTFRSHALAHANVVVEG
jgi:hypothetical protein